MAKKTSKSSFRNKVTTNAQKTSKDSNVVSYLKIPRDIELLNPEPECILRLDFIPYVVTDSRHPDRDPETNTAMKGTQWYRRPFMIHRNIGVDQDMVVCLKSFGKKCPVCEFRAKRKREGASNDELKAYNASYRNLYLVIPKRSRKYEETLHVFDISDYLFQDLLTKELKENPDKEIFPDLEEGYEVKVRFEPGTFTTAKPYPQASRIDFEIREEQYDPDFINEVPSLDDMLRQLTYEELETRLLEGTSGDTNDDDLEVIDDEEDESPRKSKKKTTAPVKDDDFYEEDDNDEEEEDEPVRKKKTVNKPTTRSKKDDDEEEEDDDTPVKASKKRKITRKPMKDDFDDEEEEEEDEPVKKSNKKTSSSQKSEKTCPHGLKFGIDTEQYDVCDTCDIWSECVAENEKK